MKNILARLLLIWLSIQLLMLPGCRQVETVSEEVAIQEQPAAPVEITSKAEIDRLWKEYVYHAVRTVIGKEAFDIPAEADPDAVVIFCWRKYVMEQGKENLEKTLEAAGDNGRRKLFPLATAREYAKRYFDLDDIDLGRMDEVPYDIEREGFSMYLNRPQHIPYYLMMDNHNVWYEALRHADGSIKVTLHDYTYDDIVNRVTQCTLREREDGSLYIFSGSEEYVEQRLVRFQGTYQEFAYLEMLDQSYEVQLISEQENHVLIQTDDKRTPVINMDMDGLSIVKELRLDEEDDFLWSREKEGRLYIGLSDRVQVYDLDLEWIEEVGLPESMVELNPDEYIHGYDISADLNRIAYTDNQGLKLFELDKGHETLIVPSEQHKFQDAVDYTVNYAYPRFVAGDTRILTVKNGYEGYDGYYLFDESGAEIVHTGAFEGVATTLSYPGQGMLSSFHTPEYIEDQAINNYRISYLDFEQATTRTADQELLGGYMGEIIFSSMVINGERYSAFLTRDYMEDIMYINRLDNASLEVEGNLLSIQHARVELIGILEDGRILFSYYRNPVEKGLGLIPRVSEMM